MNQKEIKINYTVFDLNELEIYEQELIRESLKARSMAYAPNSLFQVGAALLLENGDVILGNNQENIASPSGLCAERVALFYYGSQKLNSKIKAIAVSAQNQQLNYSDFISPCGACLQVMAEYEMNQNREIDYLLYSNTNKVIKIKGIKSLMPFYFRGTN